VIDITLSIVESALEGVEGRLEVGWGKKEKISTGTLWMVWISACVFWGKVGSSEA